MTDTVQSTIITATVAAVFTLLGFMARTGWDNYQEKRTRRRAHHKRLLAFNHLLKAGKEAFGLQCEWRDRLIASLRERNSPGLDQIGFDRILSVAFPSMTMDERELHMIIRASTQFVLKPLNESQLEWIRAEDHFRLAQPDGVVLPELPAMLVELERHLLLWLSKYEAWLPDRPEHCLVYTGDEKRHGFPFPSKIDDMVAEQLKKYE